MSAIELKERLIEKIQKTDNENILEEIYRLLDLELEADNIEVYKLNESEKNEISHSRQQIKEVQFLTNDEANKEIDKWLRK